MTSTRVYRTLAKGLAAAVLAGAFLLASPQKASAQQFAVGVQFGQPVYGYDDGGRDFYQRERYKHARHEAWERQQAYAQHEAWERQQDYLRHEAWEHRDAYEHGFGEYRHDHDRGDDHERGYDRDWDRGR